MRAKMPWLLPDKVKYVIPFFYIFFFDFFQPDNSAWWDHMLLLYGQGGTLILNNQLQGKLKLEGGHQNLRQLNCSFTTISSHFSAIYINIFNKTEIQTIILRCWTGFYLNWFKGYDTKRKYFCFQYLLIL